MKIGKYIGTYITYFKVYLLVNVKFTLFELFLVAEEVEWFSDEKPVPDERFPGQVL